MDGSLAWHMTSIPLSDDSQALVHRMNMGDTAVSFALEPEDPAILSGHSIKRNALLHESQSAANCAAVKVHRLQAGPENERRLIPSCE